MCSLMLSEKLQNIDETKLHFASSSLCFETLKCFPRIHRKTRLTSISWLSSSSPPVNPFLKMLSPSPKQFRHMYTSNNFHMETDVKNSFQLLCDLTIPLQKSFHFFVILWANCWPVSCFWIMYESHKHGYTVVIRVATNTRVAVDPIDYHYGVV